MSRNNRKLIAIAVTGVFAMPLAAEAQSNVTTYGRLYPEIVNVKLSGASAKGTAVSTLAAAASGDADVTTLSMDSPNARLGFRGSEDLGKGLKAIFQLEMGFSIDSGTNTAGQLFNRNSFVGMKGGFGTVKLGVMDTVYKEIGDTLSLLGVTSGNFMSASNILSKQGFGTSSASSFHLRRANSIYYESPEFGGVQGLFDYSLGETPGSTSKGRVISVGLKYEAGPLYLAVAHETHDNLFGASRNIAAALANNTNANASSMDTATRWTAQYKFNDDSRIEGNFATMKFDESGGAVGKFANYKHNSWAIIAEHKVTKAVTLVGSYGQAGAGSCALVGGVACNTTGLDGKMLNVGAGYDFSKRTTAFAFYTLMTNGRSAVYNNMDSGRPTPGQDISTVAVGLRHNF